MENNLSLNKISAAAKTLKVLSHPVRLKVVEFLESGEKNVGSIRDYINLEQAVTSQHLKLMYMNGLLKKRRDGNFIYYSINNDILKGILTCVRDCKN